MIGCIHGCCTYLILSLLTKFFYLIFGSSIWKLEALCISVVKKIKDTLGWPEDIMTDPHVGAWSGQPPSYLIRERDAHLAQDGNFSTTRSTGDVPTHADLSNSLASSSLESNTESQMTTAQDIASFQVIADDFICLFPVLYK